MDDEELEQYLAALAAGEEDDEDDGQTNSNDEMRERMEEAKNRAKERGKERANKFRDGNAHDLKQPMRDMKNGAKKKMQSSGGSNAGKAAGNAGKAAGNAGKAAGKGAKAAGKGAKAAGKGAKVAGKGAKAAGKGAKVVGKAAGKVLAAIVKFLASNPWVLLVVVIIIIIVAIIFAVIYKTSKDAEDSVDTGFASSIGIYTEGGAESEAAKLYYDTSSLLLASDEELEAMNQDYLSKYSGSTSMYYTAFSTLFSSDEVYPSIAARVTQISTNGANDTSETLPTVNGYNSLNADAASIKTERNIFSHVLRAEKYNFNNIKWRTFIDGKEDNENITFTTDEISKLQYPNDHSGATNEADLTLEFFITKVRPYIQSWRIPLDLLLGTIDSSLNTSFAYSIISRAYHDIVLDRYKMESTTRVNNYRIYDQTTTVTTTERICDDYKTTGSEKCKGGKGCSGGQHYYDDYALENGKLVTVQLPCTDYMYEHNISQCSYGTKGKSSTVKYCVDVEKTDVTVEKIRENIKTEDKKQYSWSYVVSMAKMFDNVISNEYLFEEHYNHKIDNYNNFINKANGYENIDVETYIESEKVSSHADEFENESVIYRPAPEIVKESGDKTWNSTQVVYAEKLASEYKVAGVTYKKQGKEESKIINKTTVVEKDGKEYTDTYTWNDMLNFDKSMSGKYDLNSVKEVTGEPLSDQKHYTSLAKAGKLNLVDLMNSDPEIFNEYIESEDIAYSTNIGLSRGSLDLSYLTLKEDLKEISEKYPLSGLMYGTSFNIVQGTNLSAVIQAGSVNQALISLAESYLGNTLREMRAYDDVGIFTIDGHWCAMFVSFCLRKLEQMTGAVIPIPTYRSCSWKMWDPYHLMPGFYDVKEWVDSNPSSTWSNGHTKYLAQGGQEHIRPLSDIQPGDIILFNWLNKKRR